jgi:Sec-independent protein secretion pathway component TatC
MVKRSKTPLYVGLLLIVGCLIYLGSGSLAWVIGIIAIGAIAVLLTQTDKTRLRIKFKKLGENKRQPEEKAKTLVGGWIVLYLVAVGILAFVLGLFGANPFGAVVASALIVAVLAIIPVIFAWIYRFIDASLPPSWKKTIGTAFFLLCIVVFLYAVFFGATIFWGAVDRFYEFAMNAHAPVPQNY